MTVLYISHMKVKQDELGRWVTTLTQEVMAKINPYAERTFINTLLQIDENEECIEFQREDYSELDVRGFAIQKAIDTVNGIGKLGEVAPIKPITTIDKDAIYRVEIEY